MFETILNAVLTFVFANVWVVPAALVAVCCIGIWWVSRQPDTRSYNQYGPVRPEQSVWAGKVRAKLAANAREAEAKAEADRVKREKRWAEIGYDPNSAETRAARKAEWL